MAKKRVFVVYVIRNLLDGKTYIGKTSGRSGFVAIETRLKQHRYDALRGRGSYLNQAMRKHGVQNFEIGCLHICKTERGAFALEVREIARFASEYNLTLGGEGGTTLPRKIYKKHTKLSVGGVAIKQAREACSKFYSTEIPCDVGHVSPRYVSTRQCCECHRLRYLNSAGGAYKGRYRGPRSAEFKAAVSRAMKGKFKTPETRVKMSIAATIREAARRSKMEIECHV